MNNIKTPKIPTTQSDGSPIKKYVPRARPEGSKPYIRKGGNSGKFFNKTPSVERTMQRRKVMKPHRATPIRRPAPNVPIPPIEEGIIRIIPLGGVQEVGKNMTAIEIGEDIIVIDAGFQFVDETTPGIDYILPNTGYLEQNKHKIRAMFITHGHLDHIGAIPFLIETIGNPPMYTREFGAIMIKKRHAEFPHLPKPNIITLDGDETTTVGNIKVKSFPISHTIPDSMGLVIDTPFGDIVFIEDVRVDNADGQPTEEEINQYKQFKKTGKDALLLTMDSTSVEKAGWSLSETVVVENIEKIMREVEGRLIIGTFASQVERILATIKLAAKYGKKVVVEGRSMKSNLEIVKQLNLIQDDSVIISMNEMDNTPMDRIVMLVTGAQGEEFAALMRMANKTHKSVKLRETDTILLSSSIIPGNHTAVTKLKDKLYRTNANIITYMDADVHASGHGNREELGWIHEQIPYKFFVPLHGNHHMLQQHKKLAMSLGAPEENIIVPDNGSVIEIYDGGSKIRTLEMKAPNEVVTVDGFSIGDIQEVVMRDRQTLAENGIFVIVASINVKTKKLKKSPDIISRGFVYLRESQNLLHDTRRRVQKIIEEQAAGMDHVDFDKIKDAVAQDITKHLFQQTAKSPIVIPVILGV